MQWLGLRTECAFFFFFSVGFFVFFGGGGFFDELNMLMNV